MRAYLNCKNVETAINRAKKMLIDEAEKHGVYENFGKIEAQEIYDHFVVDNDYTWWMNRIRKEIRDFSEWCKEYGRRL